MTKEELAILEEEAKAAEENPQAPSKATVGDYAVETVCHADFAQGCEDPTDDEE